MLRLVWGRLPAATHAARSSYTLGSESIYSSMAWAARHFATAAPQAGAATLVGASNVPLAYDPHMALALVKKGAKARFDESVDVAVNLGVDPRKPGQSVRGVVSLPFGTGKSVRVAVFAKGDKADQARAAGADIVGADDLIKQIQAGVIEFDRCIATPDMMPLVGRVARILGPRGLMPNPKVGTVTNDLTEAITSSRAGQVEFRVEKAGIVHATIGRVSFPVDKLAGNLKALMVALSRARPDGSKGTYIRRVTVASTMGRGFQVNEQFVDPTKARQFMMSEPLSEELQRDLTQAGAAMSQRVADWAKIKATRPKRQKAYTKEKKE